MIGNTFVNSINGVADTPIPVGAVVEYKWGERYDSYPRRLRVVACPRHGKALALTHDGSITVRGTYAPMKVLSVPGGAE